MKHAEAPATAPRSLWRRLRDRVWERFWFVFIDGEDHPQVKP